MKTIRKELMPLFKEEVQYRQNNELKLDTTELLKMRKSLEQIRNLASLQHLENLKELLKLYLKVHRHFHLISQVNPQENLKEWKIAFMHSCKTLKVCM